MRSSIFKDLRVIILILAIAGSLVAISPHYEEGSLKTNLKLGLDFVGGSSIQLKLEGCMVEIQSSKEKIIGHELGDKYHLSNSGDDFVEFTCEDENATVIEDLKKLGYGTPTLESNLIKFNITDIGATIIYLGKKTEYEILLLEEEPPKYEIRGAILTEEERKGLTDEEIKAKSEEKLRGYLNEVEAVLISYEDRVSSFTTKQTKDIISTKLNYVGLKDIKVRIWGEDYILIDLAGMPLEEARDYVAEPGKFEIKIFVNETETKLICTGASIKRVSSYSRDTMTGTWQVPFELTNEASDIFREMCIEYGAADNPEAHPIAMYLDDEEVFKAPLSSSLAMDIKNGVWSGGGLEASMGGDDEESRLRAKELETHLRAGALPVKPVIMSEGYIDPVLGKNFLKQVFIAIILAIVAVGFIVYVRYHEKKIVVPMLITGFSETFIVLGVAALIGHQLDLPSLGGIIATLGTGVDQLVIITDEVLRGEAVSRKSLAKRVSAAFAIIFASAATTVIAMTPLAYMQLGVLKGFAVVTIIGIFVGIFITRPAYGNIIKKILG
ncbi:MAG: preprotein translocase subunit SecD [Methanomicrobia archaeon]|nr:preprotein translocase subunit SecD [Methanomicrobia archaeon]